MQRLLAAMQWLMIWFGDNVNNYEIESEHALMRDVF
jgi:hypothetical protein